MDNDCRSPLRMITWFSQFFLVAQQLDKKINKTNSLMIPYTRFNNFCMILLLIFEIMKHCFHTIHYMVDGSIRCMLLHTITTTMIKTLYATHDKDIKRKKRKFASTKYQNASHITLIKKVLKH